MPQFSYKARDEFGKMVRGRQVAEEVDQLADVLRVQNLYLISVSEKKRPLISFGAPKIKRRELIDFSYHMGVILSAGIPILQGLQDLANQREGSRLGKILPRIVEDVQGGALVHEALSRHPRAFGETYVSMIEAGEASGNLEKILKELTNYLEWQEDLSSNIKKITIYPFAVMVAISCLIILVFAFAFPRILPILETLNVPLPLSTRILIGVSNLFQSYWYVVLIGGIGATIGARLISHFGVGRRIIDRLKLRIPLIGGLLRKIYVSRFAHHLGVLLDAGIGIIRALTLVEAVVGNRVIGEATRMIREQVQAGATLSEALSRSGEFPQMVIRMISVGETSGTLSDALGKVSDYYDQEVPATVKKVFSALEPALIVFLAVIVMAVALSIYLPIYQGIGMIGK